MAFITQDQKRQIESAIRDLETRTCGEIVCVIAESSDRYRFIPLLWASLVALAILPFIALVLPSIELTNLYAIQLAAFVGSWGILRLPAIRKWIIPRQVQKQRASKLAHEAFIHLGIHNTTHRAGILLFVSAEERYVELIADKGINQNATEDTWSDAISAFIIDVKKGDIPKGFIDCIDRCGELLVDKFPADITEDSEQLANVVLEIDHDHFG